MTVDELEQKLNRPMMVLKFARPFEKDDTPRGRGAKKRADKARQEIENLVYSFCGIR